MRRIAWLSALVVVAAAGAIAYLIGAPYQGFQGETFLVFGRGTGAIEMGRELAQAGVIRSPWEFWMERALHAGAKLQAGEYRFHQPATPGDVFRRIARGDVYYVEFTVDEGANMFDIAQGLETLGVMPAADFLRAASDTKPIRDIDPWAKSLEGYLFPSTYRLDHSTTPAQLCREMTDQFRKQWHKLAAGRQTRVHDIITLASMVEKETGLPAERPLVAGVFLNRLKKGMRMECDPTTVYAALLDNRYRDVIHKSDLASQNPYNTYQHAGLPPGPIANPGAQSIQAALSPAATDYLYFVAKPEGGGHNFSTTLASHEKATREYRKKARKAG
ncbi:MAG TPA: endolytic transglycosylase MltG [Bryobacteraceae bacterium]|nr:endolytic transglycosylase MltG [Bryobacteraceae bacterium]